MTARNFVGLVPGFLLAAIVYSLPTVAPVDGECPDGYVGPTMGVCIPVFSTPKPKPTPAEPSRPKKPVDVCPVPL